MSEVKKKKALLVTCSLLIVLAVPPIPVAEEGEEEEAAGLFRKLNELPLPSIPSTPPFFGENDALHIIMEKGRLLTFPPGEAKGNPTLDLVPPPSGAVFGIDGDVIYADPGGGINLFRLSSKGISERLDKGGFQGLVGAARDGERIYLSDAGTGLFVFERGSLSDGFLWQMRGGGEALFTTPVIKGDYLYTASKEGEIFCLDKTRGEILWRYGTGKEVLVAPLVTETRLALPHGKKKLLALKLPPEGSGGKPRKIWKATTGGKITVRPVFYKGGIAFPSKDGYLYFLKEKDGNRLWRAELPKRDTKQMFLSGFRLYLLPEFSSEIYCYDIRNGSIADIFRLESEDEYFLTPMVFNASENLIAIGAGTYSFRIILIEIKSRPGV